MNRKRKRGGHAPAKGKKKMKFEQLELFPNMKQTPPRETKIKPSLSEIVTGLPLLDPMEREERNTVQTKLF